MEHLIDVSERVRLYYMRKSPSMSKYYTRLQRTLYELLRFALLGDRTRYRDGSLHFVENGKTQKFLQSIAKVYKWKA